MPAESDEMCAFHTVQTAVDALAGRDDVPDGGAVLGCDVTTHFASRLLADHAAILDAALDEIDDISENRWAMRRWPLRLRARHGCARPPR